MSDLVFEKEYKYQEELDRLTGFIRDYCRTGTMSFEVLKTFLDYQISKKVSETGRNSNEVISWLQKDFIDAIHEWDK